MTQHMAFYTDAAVSSMVDCGIGGIWVDGRRRVLSH